MERHDVLAMSRVHARGAHDDGAEARGHACRLRRHPCHMDAEGAQAPPSGAADHRYAAAGRDRRQEGTLDQVPDGLRQAADGQGAGRLRLRRLAGQRAPDPGAHRRRLPRRASATSCWSAAPAPERPISPSPSRAPASARAHAAAATTSSTWSTTSRPRLRAGRQGRTADQLVRRDFVILDELGYLPFATILPLGRRAAALPPHEPALRAHLDRHHNKPRLRRMAIRLRRPQDDHRPARSSHPPLRDHRDRQRELALQEPLLTWRRPSLRPGCPGGPTGTPHAASLRVTRGATRSRAGPPYWLPGQPPPCRSGGSILHADWGSILNAD